MNKIVWNLHWKHTHTHTHTHHHSYKSKIKNNIRRKFDKLWPKMYHRDLWETAVRVHDRNYHTLPHQPLPHSLQPPHSTTIASTHHTLPHTTTPASTHHTVPHSPQSSNAVPIPISDPANNDDCKQTNKQTNKTVVTMNTKLQWHNRLGCVETRLQWQWQWQCGCTDREQNHYIYKGFVNSRW